MEELDKLMKGEGLTEDKKNELAAKKMQKVISKMVHENNDKVAKKYVDKVVLGTDGWKARYYKEKFHVSGEELPDFLKRIKYAYIEGL